MIISSFQSVKNSLSPIIGSLKTVYVFSTRTKRGNTNRINIPINCIFIFSNGNCMANSITAPDLNIILEGGDPNWENSLMQNKYDSYYPYTQKSTLAKIVQYLESYNQKINIRYDL